MCARSGWYSAYTFRIELLGFNADPQRRKPIWALWAAFSTGTKRKAEVLTAEIEILNLSTMLLADAYEICPQHANSQSIVVVNPEKYYPLPHLKVIEVPFLLFLPESTMVAALHIVAVSA